MRGMIKTAHCLLFTRSCFFCRYGKLEPTLDRADVSYVCLFLSCYLFVCLTVLVYRTSEGSIFYYEQLQKSTHTNSNYSSVSPKLWGYSSKGIERRFLILLCFFLGSCVFFNCLLIRNTSVLLDGDRLGLARGARS